MIISAESVDAYNSALSTYTEKASGELSDFIASLDIGDTYESKEAARNAVIEKTQELLSVYGDSAASEAADYYEAIAQAAKVKTQDALLAEVASDKSVENSIRYNAKSLWGETVDIVEFTNGCNASLTRYIKQAANETMTLNAVRDGKKGMRFARKPSGKETCAFCIMLASRGFVYATSKTAGEFHHYHDHCDCIVIAGFGDTTIEGYDLAKYESIYNEAAKSDNPISAISRNLYDEIKDDRNARRRELYAKAQK